MEEYTNSLSDKEKKALAIAKEHLETSYSMHKSIGYLKWQQTTKSTDK